jgi:hypothetical protein
MGRQPGRAAAQNAGREDGPECRRELTIVDVVGRTLVVQKEDRRKAALERLATLNWTLPPDYKFDRDEANER